MNLIQKKKRVKVSVAHEIKSCTLSIIIQFLHLNRGDHVRCRGVKSPENKQSLVSGLHYHYQLSSLLYYFHYH